MLVPAPMEGTSLKGIHRERVSAVLVLALVSILAGRADCRTWVVAQDGSGDYALIRPACEAAASGDSLLIRPGLYEDDDQEWALFIANKSLSFIGTGADRDQVQIRILLWLESCNNVLLENLSFADHHHACWFEGGSGIIRNCAVRRCGSVETYAPVQAYSDARVLIEDCVFEGNRNTASGDPLNAIGGAVRGEWFTIRDCQFVDNAAAGPGGAVELANATIENCVFFRNEAPSGAAAFLRGNVYIHNCTFLQNRVTSPGGAAVWIFRDLPSEVDHLIVAGTIGGAAVECDDYREYYCCDFWNNEGGDYYGLACAILESYGDFSLDPLFCDLVTGDVGLGEGSPCLPGTHGGVECGLIGARGVGCGLSPTRTISWGMLKALYR